MSELSFTWNGISSEEMGVEVLRLPDLIAPALRGDTLRVSGRDGTLFLPDGAREEIVLLAECYLPYEQGGYVAPLDEIKQWLTGEGWFSQSDLPDRRFRARITDSIPFQPVMVGFQDRIFGLTLYADPYQYADPASKPIVLTQADIIRSPGTAPSSPRITLRASGDVTLVVGGEIMAFTGLTDGIIIDSELMDCFDPEQTQLMNHAAYIDCFPVLQPGANAISWTGEVESVTIEPRWRYL